MPKDKKLSAHLATNKILTDETKERLKETDSYFNTEDRGYLQTEHERERTLKVT
jgi:hypothetical protein